MERIKKRVEANDAVAIYNLGHHYFHGRMDLPRDFERAMELWLRAGELGDARAFYSLGTAYYCGRGVERDMTKAKYYYEVAAMVGNVDARHTLGIFEKNEDKMDRAVKHFMIAAGAGDDEALKNIREGYLNGHATKDEFERALRAHKEANDEMKSVQREAAAAISGN